MALPLIGTPLMKAYEEIQRKKDVVDDDKTSCIWQTSRVSNDFKLKLTQWHDTIQSYTKTSILYSWI